MVFAPELFLFLPFLSRST